MRCEVKAEVVSKGVVMTRTYKMKARTPTEAEVRFTGKLAKGWKPKGTTRCAFLSAHVAAGTNYRPEGLLLGKL